MKGVPEEQPVMGGPEFPEQLYPNGLAAVPVPPVNVQLGNGGPCSVQSPRALMEIGAGPTVVVMKTYTALVAPTELDVLLEKMVEFVDCANAATGSRSMASQRRTQREARTISVLQGTIAR
jgi:hypothetical protein